LLPRLSSTLGERFHGGVVRIMVVVILRFLRTLRVLARVLAPKYDEGVTGTRNPARIAIPVSLCSPVGRGCDSGVRDPRQRGQRDGLGLRRVGFRKGGIERGTNGTEGCTRGCNGIDGHEIHVLRDVHFHVVVASRGPTMDGIVGGQHS
jgi:hypothetical protein